MRSSNFRRGDRVVTLGYGNSGSGDVSSAPHDSGKRRGAVTEENGVVIKVKLDGQDVTHHYYAWFFPCQLRKLVKKAKAA